MQWKQFSVFALVLNITRTSTTSYVITVDVGRPVGDLKHFWTSTGFCPPLPHTQAHQFDLSVDQQQNLAHVGSVPHGGIQQVRIHWMLELVTAQDIGGQPQYNFTKLDQLIDLLWINGLRPGFELMGSVSNYFTDFEDKSQVFEWRNLVYLIAKRYIEQYGLGTVSQWNFETWNEPNNHDFDNVSVSIQGFLNYYDACSEGLLAASSLLKFGGPGDSCHSPPHSPYCWAMLQHCFNGTNYFTGETGVRIDYIALHKKGGGFSLPILQQEIQTMGEIQERFPRFSSLPVYNDEADPLVGWSRPQEWRADVTARFQVNNTQPPHVQIIRKPVLSVMGLLALLGETQVLSQVLSSVGTNSTVGVLASIHSPVTERGSDSWQAALLLFNSDDNSSSTDTDDVRLSLKGLAAQKGLVYVAYYIDNNLTNPYGLWQRMGRPDFPTAEQFRRLRSEQHPHVDGPLEVPAGDTLTLRARLSLPSVLLVHICARPKAEPDQVNGLRFIRITKGQVLIVWSDHCVDSKCIKTFEVEFSPDHEEFSRINTQNTMFTSYVYSPVDLQVGGLYRVRAVDYWGRPGQYSLPERYSEEK